MSFAKKIATAAPGNDLFDRGERASVTGLHVRTHAARPGRPLRRAFMFYYRAGGKQRRMLLGDTGSMSVGEARAEAAKLAARVRLGGDPIAEIVAKDAEQRAAQQTVGDLWEIAARDHYRIDTAAVRSWAWQAGRIWELELAPTFAKVPTADLRRGAVRTWHDKYLNDRPTQGNRALAVLRKVFAHAIAYEHLEGANPCSTIQGHPEIERNRYATDEELAKLARILDRDATTYPREVAFLWTLAYTGARPSALARATWGQLTRTEIDGQEVGVLEYHGKTTSATGVMGRIVMPAAALELFDRLPRLAGDPRIFRLAGVPKHYWAKVRTEAGCPDLWARDWRKTFATIGLGAGESIDVIGRTLEQVSAQTTLRYARAVPRAQVKVATAVAGELDAIRARAAAAGK